MPITWGTLRQNIRDTLLQDAIPDEETGEFKHSDEALLVYCGWALDAFADHTAVATATSFAVNDDGAYDLPENIYDEDPIDVTLTVFQELADGTRDYLDPIKYFEGVSLKDGVGFYVAAGNVLQVTKTLSSAATLNVWHYAYYNHPVSDSDPISVPKWAVTALSYLIAAHALSGLSLKTANIRQYGAKPDTGAPEQNPLAKQQERYFCLYKDELSRHDPQMRVVTERFSENTW